MFCSCLRGDALVRPGRHVLAYCRMHKNLAPIDREAMWCPILCPENISDYCKELWAGPPPSIAPRSFPRSLQVRLGVSSMPSHTWRVR